MIERSRQLIKERGELIVLYFNFVRYSKIEEIYGWEKLDAVLETDGAGGPRVSRRERARSVARHGELHERRRLRLLPRAAAGGSGGSRTARSLSSCRTCRSTWAADRGRHGEEIASLFEIYVGRAHVYYNPKIACSV
jgi:hypothetical protein